MKWLHVIASVDPQGGGPMEGVRQLAPELRRLGVQTEVLSLDAPDEAFVDAFPVQVHALGPGRGKYGYDPKVVPWLQERRGDYDAVIVNGLWQYNGFAAWRALAGTDTPYFVFTHGMLDPWFKRAYPLKHLKKWLYWPWADYRLLRDAKAVLFTCEEERRLAKDSFWLYRCNEVVTSYGTNQPPGDPDGALADGFVARHPELAGKRILLFLSRIHEKKGCDLLIRALAEVASGYPDLHLVMAGPDQTGWAGELKQLAASLGIADRLTWPGMLQGDDKWGAYHAAEAFCLPSHQENFGIVVAEALGCGKPVLISDKVNIWREIEADGAGVVSPDTLEGTRSGLATWLSKRWEDKAVMQAATLRCFDARFRIEQVARDLVERVKSSMTRSDGLSEAGS